FRPVRAALDARREEQARREAEIAAKLAEAERQRSEIAARHREVAAELDRRRNEAREAADGEAAAIREAAHEAVRREQAALSSNLTERRQQPLWDLSRQVADAASDMVVRLLLQLDSKDLHRALVRIAAREAATLATG